MASDSKFASTSTEWRPWDAEGEFIKCQKGISSDTLLMDFYGFFGLFFGVFLEFVVFFCVFYGFLKCFGFASWCICRGVKGFGFESWVQHILTLVFCCGSFLGELYGFEEGFIGSRELWVICFLGLLKGTIWTNFVRVLEQIQVSLTGFCLASN